MNNRERALAVLRYKPCDRLPIVHFGYWRETLIRWAEQGHIPLGAAQEWADGTPVDKMIGDALGFDFGWNNCFHPGLDLSPKFEPKVLKERPDGSREVLNNYGVVELVKDGVVSIACEIDHTLKSRADWESMYLPKLQFSEDRILNANVNTGEEFLSFNQGGLEFLKAGKWENCVVGLNCGSVIGRVRNWLGVEGLSYLYVDDEPLLDEIINVNADLSFECVKYTLQAGAKFDFIHFWEDICFKNGPLVSPAVFRDKIAPHYRRFTDLARDYGIDIASVDCDGLIDALVLMWLENGVNTMFPIEVGTWNASIQPWRRQYGRQALGVGGMNKVVFAHDYAAIDAEIERLKPLVELGGYIPCPDHRIAPDAKWENVQYYCEKMRETFS